MFLQKNSYYTTTLGFWTLIFKISYDYLMIRFILRQLKTALSHTCDRPIFKNLTVILR